jgi:hypothetical protein
MTQNQAQYNEATESLTLYQYNLTDENRFEYPGTYKIVITLESELKNELNKYKESIISIINRVNYNIRIEGANKVEQLTRYLKVIYKDIHTISEQFHDNQLYVKYKPLFDNFFEELLSQDNQTVKEKSATKINSSSGHVEKPSKVKTFELLKSNYRINLLHSNLISAPSLIDPIPLDDFKKLFSNKEEMLAINWLINKNQVSYLIKRLIDAGVINSYGAWEAAQFYFTVKGDSVRHLRGSNRISLQSKRRIDSLLPL